MCGEDLRPAGVVECEPIGMRLVEGTLGHEPTAYRALGLDDDPAATLQLGGELLVGDGA